MLIDKKIKISIQEFFPNGDDFEVTDSQAVVDIQDLIEVTRNIVDMSTQELLERLSTQPPLIDSIVAETKNNNHATPDVEYIAFCIELSNRLIRKHKLNKLYSEINPIDSNDLMD